MLSLIKIQRYKSLFDVTINLEPLTVFIGPNSSGKSNICEALVVLSYLIKDFDLKQSVENLPGKQNWQDKYWRGKTASMSFGLSVHKVKEIQHEIQVSDTTIRHSLSIESISPIIKEALERVVVYDFNPALLLQASAGRQMTSTGEGIANALTDILFDNRERFNELEQRLTQLVPNISRISLKREGARSLLRLVDKYSDHLIPASDISDGTLRILAFLSALYQVRVPNIMCFEEPENGIHPWLLHKIIEMLNLVSTKGIVGKPVQVLITTHSPVLLNYVKPEQVRAVELDYEGKTQVHALPTDTARFQAAMEAYDGELGELWFTNLFGGNPE